MTRGAATVLRTIIDAALRGRLDEALVRQLHELGPEAVALAMLSTSKHIAEQDTRLHATTFRSFRRKPSPDSIHHSL